LWNKTLQKIKNLSNKSKRKIIKYTIYSLLTFNTLVNITQIINASNVDNSTQEMTIEILDEISNVKKDTSKFKKGHQCILSQNGWNHIKEEEKLKLIAYKIGDGKITVGYGHAEPASKSTLKVGEKITKEKAFDLLKKDIKITADGVRRIFKQWESDDINVPITQNMFDALVSMAYNAGVTGLKKSDVITHLKNGNYQQAAENILTFKINNKFPGLVKRRQKENKMFLATL